MLIVAHVKSSNERREGERGRGLLVAVLNVKLLEKDVHIRERERVTPQCVIQH